MGFMDKAKEAAEDLKASFASNEVRDSEQAYRDLGMLAYLTTTGRPIDEADRQRLINTLWAIEQQGKLPAFRLVTSPPPPPPPPPVPQQPAAASAAASASRARRSPPHLRSPPFPRSLPLPRHLRHRRHPRRHQRAGRGRRAGAHRWLRKAR